MQSAAYRAFRKHGSKRDVKAFKKDFDNRCMSLFLPLEEVEIENQCGYIFKNSTNQLTYIEV